MTTKLALRYTALTDMGLRRSSNQDSAYASDRLLIVADGMGGAAAGDLASAEALGVLRELDDELDDDALTALRQGVQDANARLAALIESDPSVEGMGTTVEAMLFDGDKFAVAHIGDSRSYRLRGGKLTQLSIDHTFVQSLVEEGKLTPAEAREHPHRSLLLRALLGRDDNAADLSWLQPQLGDRYLLCSDGLTDMVLDATIEQVLGAPTIEQAAEELVRRALDAGGVDNVTVVIGELVDRDADLATTQEIGREPIVVGAAAAPTRTRSTRRLGGHSQRRHAQPLDPEEERYAPRPPSRLRLLRLLAGLAALALVLGLAAWFGYRWTQTQYYVSDHDGRVTIFRGVQADVPLVGLSHVDEVSPIDIADLPIFQREQVRAGIEAKSHADALDIVDELHQDVAQSPTPRPSGSPNPPSPSSRP
jgi:protein phosphatase